MELDWLVEIMAYVIKYSYVLCKFKSEMAYCVLGKVKFVIDAKIGLLKGWEMEWIGT